jgi:acyl-coenzyme A thioesterase PaaI-like protein
MVRLVHHDLCFGCGQANLFGLHLELEAIEGGALAGRFFIKQDHQGPNGSAHPGVIGAALEEAMAHLVDHAGGPEAEPRPGRITRLEIDYQGRAPVGSFVQVRAWLERDRGQGAVARAVALDDEREVPLAEARAVLLSEAPERE